MLYHQSEKGKHDSRLIVLKKVKVKHCYDDMLCLADYTSIEQFEDKNIVCIFVLELDEDSNNIILSKPRKIHYLSNGVVYLRRK